MLRFQESPPAHLAFYRDPRDMSADPQLCVSPQAIFVFNYHRQLVFIRFHFPGGRRGDGGKQSQLKFVSLFLSFGVLIVHAMTVQGETISLIFLT